MGAVAMQTVTILEGEAVTKRSRAFHAERISGVLKRSLADFIAIGSMLAEAREELSNADFTGLWQDDLGLSYSSAMRFIRIAQDPRLLRFPNLETPQPDLAALDKFQSLDDDELEACVAQGARTVDQIKEVLRSRRAQFPHRPIAAAFIRPPKRPEGSGATSYEELVYIVAEWRKSLGVSQNALDDKIGWADGLASKYEIPHHKNDGKTFTFVPGAHGRGSFWDAIQALGLAVKLVPADRPIS